MILNALKMQKVIYYKLKRRFGHTIYHRKPVVNNNDVKTGKITRLFVTIKIRRAVISPVDRMKDFIYDLTFVAANKNFTYGALFDKNTRFLIIDKHDLKNTSIGTDDHFVIDTRRYEIEKFEETEYGYLVRVKMLDNSDIIPDPMAEDS